MRAILLASATVTSLTGRRCRISLSQAPSALCQPSARPTIDVASSTSSLRMSGSRGTLPSPSPLRTVRASCPAYGSSLCRLVADLLMMFVMTPSVQEAQVLRFVFTTPMTRMGVVLVQHVGILVRIERGTA